MAAHKKQVEKKATAAKGGKVDPFKTKKTTSAPPKVNDTVTPPEKVALAIDAFRECQEQAKHFEGEATIHKDLIMEFAGEEFCRRAINGIEDSFKILGDDTMVTYVVTDSGAGLTEEDLEAFAEKWGAEAAEELITRDFASIRFDAKVLEANYDAVVNALQVLPEDILQNLFKPMLMKARPNAVGTAKRIAKTPAKLREMMNELRMKHYIK